jgi:hypothetical protein
MAHGDRGYFDILQHAIGREAQRIHEKCFQNLTHAFGRVVAFGGFGLLSDTTKSTPAFFAARVNVEARYYRDKIVAFHHVEPFSELLRHAYGRSFLKVQKKISINDNIY